MIVGFFLNARGDHLLTLPALRALREFAWRVDQDFVLVTRTELHEVFFRDLDPTLTIAVDGRYHDGGYEFDVAVVAERIGACPSVFVSLNPWHGHQVDELLARLKPQASIGFAPSFDVAVPLDFDRHSSDLAFDAVRVLWPAASIATWATEPLLPPASVEMAIEFRRSLGDGPLLVAHPDTKPEKMWRDDRWATFADAWVRRNPDGMVVDVGLSDGTLWAACAHGERVLGGLGLSLADALAIVALADAFVGVDSCFLHQADLARVPTVGLFGPTRPHEFGTRWAPHRHIHFDALGDTPVETVLTALLELNEASTAAIGRQTQAPTGAAGRIIGRATAEGTARYAARTSCAPGHFRRCRGLTLGSIGWGTGHAGIDRDLAVVGALTHALASGCNVIDTAANYGAGLAPALVGAAIRRAVWSGQLARDELFVCSKAGFFSHLEPCRRPRGSDESGHDLSPSCLAAELQLQRRILGLDTIDAFLLHNPDELLRADRGLALEAVLIEAFSFLESAANRGWIGCYGISTAESLRVPSGHPLSIDLAAVIKLAETVGGPNHHCRVVELPISLTQREGLELPAHCVDGQEVPALCAAHLLGLITLASAPLVGGSRAALAAAAAIRDLFPGVEDPGAVLVQFARSAPGVTTALAGAITSAHVDAIADLVHQSPVQLDAVISGPVR